MAGMRVLVFGDSHVWLWVLAVFLTLCPIKSQRYITSWARRPWSVTQTGSLVWQWSHTPTGFLQYVITASVLVLSALEGQPQWRCNAGSWPEMVIFVPSKRQDKWKKRWCHLTFHSKDRGLESPPSFKTFTWMHGKTTASLVSIGLHSPAALCWW